MKYFRILVFILVSSCMWSQTAAAKLLCDSIWMTRDKKTSCNIKIYRVNHNGLSLSNSSRESLIEFNDIQHKYTRDQRSCEYLCSTSWRTYRQDRLEKILFELNNDE
jgi:hypothetical protein